MRLSSIVFGARLLMLRLPSSVYYQSVDVFLYTLGCGVYSMYIVDFGLGDVERIVREVCRRVMRLSSIVFGAYLHMLRLPLRSIFAVLTYF